MAKLTLKPDSTFKAKVMIPMAGAVDAPVMFTFQYRPASELAKLGEQFEKADDVQGQIMLVASGWDLDDEFTAENVGLLIDQRPGASAAIIATYFKEAWGAREKN